MSAATLAPRAGIVIPVHHQDYVRPLHPVRDEGKKHRIANRMKLTGWQGVPLVTAPWDRSQLLTGVHRTAAWQLIGRPMREIPLVDIRDLVTAYTDLNGQVWARAYEIAPEVPPVVGSPDWELIAEAFADAFEELPEHVRTVYGINYHFRWVSSESPSDRAA